MHVHVGVQTEQRAMQHIGDGALDALARIRDGLDGAQGRVEDALLRPLPPGPDPRVVRERSAANHRDGAVRAPVSLVVRHGNSLNGLPRSGRNDTTVSTYPRSMTRPERHSPPRATVR